MRGLGGGLALALLGCGMMLGTGDKSDGMNRVATVFVGDAMIYNM